jgi:glutathione synthase/RimK-type ligase-like ATP-grasp enzyme
MVAQELAKACLPFRVFNQRNVARCSMSWQMDDAGLDGKLVLEGEEILLSSIDAVYLRLMDDRILPELEGLPPNDPARLQARAFHDAMFRWAEVTPARVVNRSDPQGANSSKPYQAQLITAHGLRVPETLVTNDPADVLAFRKRYGNLVYKSVSGVRSIVQTLEHQDLDRLEQIRWCPVQFQQRLVGRDVRVHVIGGEVFATEIVSSHVDYRYARRAGGRTELREAALPHDIASRCVTMTKDMGLAFAGIDFKRTADGEWFCFEVNPSPAFSYYEANTGQPIARSVAAYLAGEFSTAPAFGGAGSR